MNLLDWLERRIGWLAVPHLTLLLIVCQVAVYLAMHGAMATSMEGVSELASGLQLVPARVREGEWWRLFSFVAVPPFTNIVLAFFGWYFFWMMGSTLEGQWGAFRYNVFLLVGYAATVAVSFLLPAPHSEVPASPVFWQGSVFLAFAWLYPDFVIQLFFILPVRIKWLALLTWIGYGLSALFGDWGTRLVILAAVCNFLLFFGREILQRVGMGRRHMLSQLHTIGAREPSYHHRCLVCGLTDRDDPAMDFRYCSKCDGSCCYCAAHLKSHEHVVTAKT